MNNVDVSFITLSYNKFDILRQSIESIIEHTKNVTYEHIILDNNSTEGSIFDVTADFSNVRVYVSKENSGWSAGINKAVSKSKGKYICIVDNDVLFVDNVALKLLKTCEEYGGNIIAGPRVLNSDKSVQNTIADYPTWSNKLSMAALLSKVFKRSEIFNPEYLNYQIPDQKIFPVEILMGACLFFSREQFNRLNGLDERFFLYCADSDICLRTTKNNGKVIYNSNAHVIHLGAFATGVNIHFSASNRGLDEAKFYRKHYGIFERQFIYLFSSLGIFVRFMLYFIYGIVRFNKNLINKSLYLLVYLFYFVKGIISGGTAGT